MLTNFKNGFFLGSRAVKKTGFVSKSVIIFMMVLTFLNLVVVRGVLVGIPDSSFENTRLFETGDILISKIEGESEVGKTRQIENLLKSDSDIETYSIRYSGGGVAESNYQSSKKDGANTSIRNVSVFGINPVSENALSNYSKDILEGGRDLRLNDSNSVLIGADLLSSAENNFTDDELLTGVEVGSKVLLTVSGVTEEYTVAGIIDSKQATSQRVLMNSTKLRQLLGKVNPNASEIAVRIKGDVNGDIKAQEFRDNFSFSESKVETYRQAVGAFLDDIKTIFDFLSGFIGFIAIFISAITIFIVIFINVVSRKKEIGVAKAIGIPKSTIIFSYFVQAMFYAFFGIVIGLVLFVYFLDPYFRANPINFPFTDVYLSSPPKVMFFQSLILLLSAGVAGFLPARMIIKEKILSLILTD